MKTCVLVLENIRSVENTASMFRTADGLGVAKIYLIGITPTPLDRFGRKRDDFSKVALGAEEAVPWEYAKTTEEVIEELLSQNFTIVSLEQTDASVNLRGYKAPGMFALIVGNEVDGVSGQALNASQAVLEIEMKGEKESLNVSVSAGIALYELMNG